MSYYVELNVEVRESRLHGKGVFAVVDMPEGHYVGNYEGPPPGPGYSRFDLYDYESNTTRRGRNQLRYMNADTPGNCDMWGFDCFTTQDIKAGEELTFDYDDVE